jgi:hydroxymethylbilane synthase
MLLKVATRKSPLAIKQSEMVCDWLSARLCEHTFELYPVSTEIDSRLDYSLEKQGGIGLFTKELDAALIEGQAEIAVHSAKDLPVELPASLKIIGYLPRDSVADILISKKDWDSIETIATSSPRRRHQLSAIFPKAQFQLIRGNVETRLNKICNDEADATILAEAGLDRLNIADYKDLVFTNLEHEIMVPAAGQGAIAIVGRVDSTLNFQSLFCQTSYEAVSIEKACLKVLDGGCQSPAGVYFYGKQLHIYHPVIAYRSFEIKETSLSGKLESAISLMKEIKTEINK